MKTILLTTVMVCVTKVCHKIQDFIQDYQLLHDGEKEDLHLLCDIKLSLSKNKMKLRIMKLNAFFSYLPTENAKQ